jgi:hypothetical protein
MPKRFLKPFLLFLFITVSGCTYLYYAKRQPLLWGYHEFYFTPSKYKRLLENIRLKNPNTIDENHKNGAFFINDFKRVLPFWYGTRYSFYGQTHMPGEGKIACGYFVTTVLEDLGVALDRNGLAQMASEEMIKKLVSEQNIKRFSGYELSDFVAQVKAKGQGLYVVGLDTHTGFILNDGQQIRFIHASGRFPFAVVNENAYTSINLQKSRYRIIGHLSNDVFFLKKRL